MNITRSTIITVIAANVRQSHNDFADKVFCSEVDHDPRNSLCVIGARIRGVVSSVDSIAARIPSAFTEHNRTFVRRHAERCKTRSHSPFVFCSHSGETDFTNISI